MAKAPYDKDNQATEETAPPDPSRRRFLKGVGIAGAGENLAAARKPQFHARIFNHAIMTAAIRK